MYDTKYFYAASPKLLDVVWELTTDNEYQINVCLSLAVSHWLIAARVTALDLSKTLVYMDMCFPKTASSNQDKYLVYNFLTDPKSTDVCWILQGVIAPGFSQVF